MHYEFSTLQDLNRDFYRQLVKHDPNYNIIQTNIYTQNVHLEKNPKNAIFVSPDKQMSNITVRAGLSHIYKGETARVKEELISTLHSAQVHQSGTGAYGKKKKKEKKGRNITKVIQPANRWIQKKRKQSSLLNTRTQNCQ